jgi:hypothetical protein
MSQSEVIANTILQQLGGRLSMMTGAHNLVALESGLQFSLRKGDARDGINRVQIILTAMDDYTVIFYKIDVRNVENPCVTVDTVEGIYCDQLMDVFENHTGLYLTLSPRQ